MAARCLAVALCLLVAGCGGDGPRRRGGATATTATTETTVATTAADPADREPPPTTGPPAGTAATDTTGPAGPSCPAVPPRAEPGPARPRYTLRIDVRLEENTVAGDLGVRFTPDLDTDRLVFRLWANSPRTAVGGARLAVGDVRVAGAAAPVEQPDVTTVVVRPPGPLVAGRPVDASLTWRLTLPGPVSDRISRSGAAVRLGSFFPVLSWEPGVGWGTEPPTSGFAEASVAAAADFDATVTAPEGLAVLATGVPDGRGRWSAVAVPDFALSVGRFTVASRTVRAPAPVEVTVGVHEGIAEAPGRYLDKLERVLADFGRRFGPYPWPTYTLAVTPQLSGGIEYPMHVMQGPGEIGRTTSHEVGHMWFYGLVGSHQGRDPWLDEGLATWAEARFEGTLADVRARPVPAEGRGRAGEPMTFWESRRSAYYRSVYVQGAQALAALGSPDLVDCGLRHYVARNAYRVARPADLLAAVSVVFPDAATVLARYGIKG